MARGLVSVILPTYNRKKYLRGAVESVLQQTYHKFELIVIDGGSDDGTVEWLQSIEDDRVKLVTHDEPRGVSTARNVGLEVSSGEYIVFLDDDDQLFEHAISTLRETIRERSRECGGVYTARLEVDESGNKNKVRVNNGKVERVIDASIGGPSCTLIRRAVVDEIGEFDESFPAWEDTDFFKRLFREFHMIALDQVLYERRRHSNQMIKNPELMLQGHKKFVEKHTAHLSDTMLSSHYYWMGKSHAQLEEWKQAKSCLRTAIRHHKTRIGPAYYYFWLQFGSVGYTVGDFFYHRIYRPVCDSLGIC